MKQGQNISRSEYKVMNILWDDPGACARDVAGEAAARYGWNKNTTYTLLKSLVEKLALRREEPDFRCFPLVSRDEAREREIGRLADLLFEGDREALLRFVLSGERGKPGPSPAVRAVSAPSRGKRLH